MEQRSAEWFKVRKGRVTGSMVGAILGFNPWMSREEAMRTMVREYHGAPREFEGNVATQWGTANEDGARAEYEMITGNTVEKCGFYEHDDWLGASPDGLIGEFGLVEIKCPYGMKKVGRTFKTAKQQMHYYAQMQIQMYVTNRKWCHFFQWSPLGHDLELVPLDQDFLAKILPELYMFWREVKDACENDFERHLTSDRAVNNELKTLQLVAEYDDTDNEIKKLLERKKELLEKIVNATGRKNTEIAGRKLTLVQKPGTISYGKIVKEFLPHLDVEKYRGESTEYWLLGK